MRYSPAVIAIGKRAFCSQVDAGEREAYHMVGPVMSRNAADAQGRTGGNGCVLGEAATGMAEQVGPVD